LPDQARGVYRARSDGARAVEYSCDPAWRQLLLREKFREPRRRDPRTERVAHLAVTPDGDADTDDVALGNPALKEVGNQRRPGVEDAQQASRITLGRQRLAKGPESVQQLAAVPVADDHVDERLVLQRRLSLAVERGEVPGGQVRRSGEREQRRPHPHEIRVDRRDQGARRCHRVA